MEHPHMTFPDELVELVAHEIFVMLHPGELPRRYHARTLAKARQLIAAIQSSSSFAVVPREATYEMFRAALATEGIKAVDNAIVIAAIHGSVLPPHMTDTKFSPLAQAWSAMISAYLAEAEVKG